MSCGRGGTTLEGAAQPRAAPGVDATEIAIRNNIIQAVSITQGFCCPRTRSPTSDATAVHYLYHVNGLYSYLDKTMLPLYSACVYIRYPRSHAFVDMYAENKIAHRKM